MTTATKKKQQKPDVETLGSGWECLFCGRKYSFLINGETFFFYPQLPDLTFTVQNNNSSTSTVRVSLYVTQLT